MHPTSYHKEILNIFSVIVPTSLMRKHGFLFNICIYCVFIIYKIYPKRKCADITFRHLLYGLTTFKNSYQKDKSAFALNIRGKENMVEGEIEFFGGSGLLQENELNAADLKCSPFRSHA